MESDLELTTYFFKYIRRIILVRAGTFEKERKILIKQKPWLKSQTTEKEDVKAFKEQMVKFVCERLKNLYKDIEKHTPSDCKDLIVLKKDAVDKAVNEKYPKLKHSNLNSANGSSFARERAYEEAQKVNLNKPGMNKTNLLY
jgi:hypothetical protein